MIIELFGLPGSGKTTFGNNLDKSEFIFVRNKKYSNIDKIKIIFQYPIFLFWLRQIILETIRSKKWLLFRFKISLLVSTFCMFSEARNIEKNTQKQVVIDEGFLQRLLSIYEEKKDVLFFKNIIQKIFLTDCVFVINFNFNNFLRYEDGENNRKRFGETYFEKWKEIIEFNYKNTLECIKLNNINSSFFENHGN